MFGLGPAGTGKTYLAVAQAVAMLTSGQVDRIVLSRPAVEAGERLGFLPGDLSEKVDPYLRPLYDALYDMLPAEQVARRLGNGEIEIAPLAFMRGRTLANAFVILDEAQNTTPMQMKMFLTRLGENGRMAVTGDTSQIDLPSGTRSGLKDAIEILQGVPGVSFVQFGDADVVRHPLVGHIVRAYDKHDAARHEAERQGTRQTTDSGDDRINHPSLKPALDISFSLEAGDWEAAVADVEQLVEAAARAAFEAAERPEILGDAPAEMSLVLADDALVQTLNRDYRDKDKPTNVLSFALLDDLDDTDDVLARDEGMPILIGDVILAFETVSAKRASRENPSGSSDALGNSWRSSSTRL